MPSLPSSNDVHVNRPLSNVSIAYAQDAADYVSGRMFATVPVAKQSDSYFTWDRADFFRNTAQVRGPGAIIPVTGLRVSTETYNCKVYADAHMISEQERANADEAINLDTVTTEDVTRKILIARDQDWADKYFTTGVWSADVTPANLWSNYATSTPVIDIRAQIFNLMKLGLSPANMKLCLGAEVYLKLVDHPHFIERFEQVEVSILNEAKLAAVLGIKEVVVARSVKNTAAEGAAASMSFIHGKNALLAYVNPAPSLNRPSAGYTMAWTGLLPGTGAMRTKKYYIDEMASDKIECEGAWDHRITSSAAGIFFSAVVV